MPVAAKVKQTREGPYEPLVYAPYVPALWVARACELSAATGLLLARLFGLATWLAGIAWTIRVAPCQRWLLAAVALLPMSVFQAASVSAAWLEGLVGLLPRIPRAGERGLAYAAVASLALVLAVSAAALLRAYYAAW